MQRKILPILLLLTFLLVSCRKEDRQRNPYLQEAKFSQLSIFAWQNTTVLESQELLYW